MILTCPSCTTRFRLPPDILGEDGHTVRCGDCAFEWFQTFDKPEEEIEEVNLDKIDEKEEVVKPEPFIATKSKPDLKTEDHMHIRRKGMISAIILFVATLIGLFLFQSTIIKLWPNAEATYALLGLTEDIPITNEDIAFERFSADLRGDELKISGKIFNLQSHDIELPPIMAVIRDESEQALEEVMLAQNNIIIKAE